MNMLRVLWGSVFIGLVAALLTSCGGLDASEDTGEIVTVQTASTATEAAAVKHLGDEVLSLMVQFEHVKRALTQWNQLETLPEEVLKLVDVDGVDFGDGRFVQTIFGPNGQPVVAFCFRHELVVEEPGDYANAHLKIEASTGVKYDFPLHTEVVHDGTKQFPEPVIRRVGDGALFSWCE